MTTEEKAQIANELKQEKVQIANELKEATRQLNLIIDRASKEKLKVRLEQGWDAVANRHGAPINAPVTVSITESFNY